MHRWFGALFRFLASPPPSLLSALSGLAIPLSSAAVREASRWAASACSGSSPLPYAAVADMFKFYELGASYPMLLGVLSQREWI